MTKVKREKRFTVHQISSKCKYGKHFAVFASTVWKVLKKAITELTSHQENFCDSLKICENHETFLSLNFCCLQYLLRIFKN